MHERKKVSFDTKMARRVHYPVLTTPVDRIDRDWRP
jgi:hypothetical protein